ncbi:MAG: biotin/lipoyl-containing protein, partial [Pontimonas sp.]
EAAVNQFGDVSVLDTRDYLYGLREGEEIVVNVEPGVSLYVELEAMSDTDDRGMRTVMASLNGQMRPVVVPDRSVSVEIPSAEKADPQQSGHVAAPFAGVTTLKVDVGQKVAVGDVLATIEAMKMEASISSQVVGTVSRLAVMPTQAVEAGDLLLVISDQ